MTDTWLRERLLGVVLLAYRELEELHRNRHELTNTRSQ